jgi:hypothetical protein
VESKNTLKENFKMAIKEQLKDTASKSTEQHYLEMEQIIKDAVKNTVSSVKENHIFIEFQKEDIKSGATYVAVRQLMDKVTRDLLEQVKPMVTQFSNEIMKIFMDACFEAISELLTEQIDKKLETKNDTTKT